MKRVTIIFITVVFIIYAVEVFSAQCPEYTPEPPVLVDTELKASVILDEKTGIYTYSYMLKNGKGSTGCIWWFGIDITYPEGGISLPEDGLVDYPRHVGRGVLSDPDTAKMIPVAFPSLPKMLNYTGAWGAGLTWDGKARWGSSSRRFRLPSGDELQGFIMTTYGLPTIRDLKVQPRYDPLPFEEGEDTVENVQELLRIRESVAVKGKTIGPTAPPADFKPLEFLDYIIGLKHEAASLGWITNKGIENSLDKKLDNARKKLEQGNTKAAKNILNAFLKEVEAQGCKSSGKCPKGKHLTPEAYGLLKYNVQYLIGQMK